MSLIPKLPEGAFSLRYLHVLGTSEYTIKYVLLSIGLNLSP